MKTIAAVAGAVLVLVVLWDGFETLVLPRRVTRKVRLARFFFRYTWLLWSRAACAISSGRFQETLLGYYGPLSLLMLLGIWAVGIITGFGLIQWAVAPAGETSGFWTNFYFSGTTFFTLGLGDVAPHTATARALTVTEAGLGFGSLALVIGYLPALNQSFSRREVNISLLDSRAGSPSTAAEMLRRHADQYGIEALRQLFMDWEIWSAELMESHLSYPILAFFRSQHDNQSWLAALTTILDASALVIVGLEGACQRQAQLAFAITCHAVLDLAHVSGTPPREPDKDRLPPAGMAELRSFLAASGLKLREGEDADRRLSELRKAYEPYVQSLSRYLRISVPPWVPEEGWADNWQTSAWGVASVAKPGRPGGRHF